MKTYLCDKCGKMIRKPKRILIEGQQKEPVLITLQKMDLCDKCHESIYAILDDFVTFKG